MVHWSGKGREQEDLQRSVARMADMGLDNMLVLTGDKLKEPSQGVRDRYLESVPAVSLVKCWRPETLVAVAINPFKYREEDAMAQYLKLGKKVGAGADFAIAQVGFDHAKHEELAEWVEHRNFALPLVANLMLLRARSARFMRKHQLAGVTVTDSFLELLEVEEKLPDQGAQRSMRRLALQICGLKLLGYAGVQLTGMHAPVQLQRLDDQVSELGELCRDASVWRQAWQECMSFPQGASVAVAPRNAWYRAASFSAPVSPLPVAARALPPAHASAMERFRYRALAATHAALFAGGPVAWLLGRALVSIRQRHGKPDNAVRSFEWLVKHPLVGCETCGMCRLEATQYVCPETCPKGLANGPCGGTSENLCEFRDRECIHSAKYRIAKDEGVLEQLETWLVPAVPAKIRGSSSYPPHFRGKGVQIRVVRFHRKND
ncbi:methylenetetrahydrofolate reductase C-terminal domain-containing protein [Lacisediminimonas sp.]|uniref:methylenetetrahydrofolate reductase C-terminal domain-containing protein n=1 Tax=Lacisediminimonas sp. TaxID=3060582 RepID=UPI00272701BE|nr:methylenetetrahydrofolate reductase C-terminal domain-containing protein [Lacisediminimonas sp.]MDO8300288.1 methylenetetrahydrofolate reductase C-terminal domain-containing protein [Lacisediminimonas sp.]